MIQSQGCILVLNVPHTIAPHKFLVMRTTTGTTLTTAYSDTVVETVSGRLYIELRLVCGDILEP